MAQPVLDYFTPAPSDRKHSVLARIALGFAVTSFLTFVFGVSQLHSSYFFFLCTPLALPLGAVAVILATITALRRRDTLWYAVLAIAISVPAIVFDALWIVGILEFPVP